MAPVTSQDKDSPDRPSGRFATCHPERKVHAKGLCQPCYRKASHGVVASCHTDRPHYAKGLCSACYWQERRLNGKVERHVLGITDAQRDAILENGVCGICHARPKKKLELDTDPRTGRLRGILCHGCRSAVLAVTSKGPTFHRSLADYLEPWTRCQSA